MTCWGGMDINSTFSQRFRDAEAVEPNLDAAGLAYHRFPKCQYLNSSSYLRGKCFGTVLFSSMVNFKVFQHLVSTNL